MGLGSRVRDALWGHPSDSPPAMLQLRWLFLRLIGACYLAAFLALGPQIVGLVGPKGALPIHDTLAAVAAHYGAASLWAAPTALWLTQGVAALYLLVACGVVFALALLVNLWPRAALAGCAVTFLSFLSVAGDFAGPGDTLLVSAAFLGWFFALPGLRPGLGAASPPSRASVFALRFFWFSVQFQAGLAKLTAPDGQWRHLWALDHYYEASAIPTWLGWRAQQLPHAFHAASAAGTLLLELGLVWLTFFPRRFRLLLFAAASTLQLGILLTANHGILNLLMIVLALPLLDDGFLQRVLPRRLRFESVAPEAPRWRSTTEAVLLGWFVCAAALIPFSGELPAPLRWPIRALEPLQLARRYHFYASIPLQRYEVEFQGSDDGERWIAYPFRFKVQDPARAPHVTTPVRARFDWAFFAVARSSCRAHRWTRRVEEALLDGEPSVLSLFAGNPFGGAPPRQVRTVYWQYWLADAPRQRKEGVYWLREERGPCGPTLTHGPDGEVSVVAEGGLRPPPLPRPER